MILRDYQSSSIEAMRKNFRDGHIRQVLVAPTGAGKSIIMLAIIMSAIEKGKRCLFICERRNLVEQFSVHLDSHGIDHGILMAKHWRFRPEALVQVASAQTLEKMESWPAIDIVFLDELHVLMRKSIINLLEKRPDLKVIGSTATPFNPLIKKYFTAVVSVTTMRELVNDKNLVPFRVFVAHEINTAGVKVVGGEWQKDELEKRGRLIVGDIVQDYLDLCQTVHGGRHAKAICFSSGIAHGTELAQKFQEAGVNAVQLASGIDENYRLDVMAEFAKDDSCIDMLISVDMLARGYDQTDIEHVILARPLRKSFSQHVQMIGRGARPHDGKAFCAIQDHSNNWLRFLRDWNDLYHDGVTELTGEQDKKPRREPTAREKKAATCPKCGCIMAGDTCAHCGHVREKRNHAITVAGEISEFDGTAQQKKFSSEYKKQFYMELLGYARLKGYADGWSYFKYREKFHKDPKWEKIAVTPSPDVLNWIKSRQIAYAKRRLS